MGVEQTLNKSQHAKLILEKKIPQQCNRAKHGGSRFGEKQNSDWI